MTDAQRAVDQLTRQLSDDVSTSERRRLITAIAHMGDGAAEPILAAHLKYAADPMVAREALHGLTSYLGLADRYIADIAELAKGEPWDREADVQPLAISVLGRWLWQHPDSRYWQVLVDIVDSSAGAPLLGSIAVQAAAQGLGYEDRAIRRSIRGASPEGVWGQEVVARARSKAIRATE